MKSTDAKITIKSIQKDISEEAFIYSYSGKYAVTEEQHIISYQEYYEEDAGMAQKSRSLIRLSGSHVSITKKGAVTTRMEFSPGDVYHGEYQTPYGNFSMEIQTDSVSSEITPDFLEIQISYTLSLNQSPVSHNLVNIKIHPDS